jgi:predicted ester cyclase
MRKTVEKNSYDIGIFWEVIVMTRSSALALPGKILALVCAGATLLTVLAAAFVYVPGVRASDDELRRLRFAHAIPELGPVDVFVNGERAFAGATFFTVTDYTEVPRNSLVEVLPAGQNPDDDHPLLSHRLHLNEGDYSIAARGSLAPHGRHPGLSLYEDDNDLPESDQVSLRVVHLSPDASGVDIFVDGKRVIRHLSYREAEDYLTLPAGSYTVGVAEAGKHTPIYEVDVTLEGGKVYTAWANGLLDPNNVDQAFKVTPSIDAAPAKPFRLRAIHAVPDIAGNPVDVFVDGEKVVTFDFFDATDYLTLFEGTYDIRVALAGQGPENAVIQAEVAFEAGKDYSVVARGTADPNDSAELGASVFEDDNSAPTPGQVRLRVGHLSPDAPPVDILVNGDRVIENLSFPTTTGYLEVAPGTYTVGVAPTGGAPIFEVDVTLESGNVYTAWANGLLTTGVAAQAFKVTPTIDAAFGDSFRLRAIHAVPDIAGNPVDVFVDGEKVVTFDFFDATDYLTLFEGTYDIRVALAGQGPENAVIQAEVAFEAGKDYSVVARGTADPNDSAELGASVFEDDNSAPTPGQVRLRVGHLSPDAPPVDILVNGDRVIENLSFPTTTGYLEVAPGTYTVGVAPTGGAPIFEVDVTLESGNVYTAWANGLLTTGIAAQAFKVTPTIDAEFGDSFRLRAIHAVPDIAGNPVDVFVDGEKVVTFDFFDATDYLTLFEGTYDIRVALAGQGPENAVIQAEVAFEAGKDYSVVARGTADPNDSAELGASVFEDDNSAPTPGQVRLRVGHLSPDAPPVDILVNGDRVIENLSFPTTTDYLEVAPGTYTVGVAPTGGAPIFEVDVTLESGNVYTAWANGLLTTGVAAQAFKVTPTIDAEFGAAARVRALNASMGNLAVDVVFENGLTITAIEPGVASNYEVIEPGDYNVQVKVAGTDITITSADFSFVAGTDYTLSFLAAVEIATRQALNSENSMLIAIIDNNNPPAEGNASIRLLHMMRGADAMDLRINGESALDNVEFMESRYVEIDAGTKNIVVTNADGSIEIVALEASLAAGSIYTLAVIEGGNGTTSLLITDVMAPAVAPASNFFIYLPTVVR